MYSQTFFTVLIIGSLISLFFVYGFQVGVFVKDHRDRHDDADQSASYADLPANHADERN
ncbi:hypothetical protein J2S70_001631 [Trueperella bonasi]|uniref:Cbb3-type cytochrome oxidase assembly protein CcoS n=1 Tax=Trueperella bonasi TaxID=312286 RepID=A0ABT9NI20_9ACTO|nr:hypothetical protein [Trueperella bonasi]MDP9807049.1 hypothetical protein [Trueperella bonasi]